MEHHSHIIIGAGISGLLCGTRLHESGFKPLILEKDSQVGGRMSSISWNNAVYDHGAQFFTARDLRFQIYVDNWIESEQCKTWFVSEGSDLGAQGYVRYCGQKSMKDLMNHIAEDLEIKTNTAVSHLTYENQKWKIWVGPECIYSCNLLVLTMPLPLALTALESGNAQLEQSIHDELKGIKYQKRISLLAQLDGDSEIGPNGIQKPSSSKIAWIADNHIKGLSNSNGVTIHTTAQFSETNWLEDDQYIIKEISKELQGFLHSEIINIKCIKWPYSFPSNSWHDLFYEDVDRKLFLAGDAFGGARVEGAALSGIQTADEIMDHSVLEKG